VNRFDRHADISLEDLEDALSSSMYASLPNDYKVASASVNQGIPVHRLAPTSALARGFGDFAVKLGAARPTDLSWFQRVLKRA
jgi:pilus assembly protein CpaE